MRNSNGRVFPTAFSRPDQIAHKARRAFGVMDIAGPIFYPQDVSGLGQMSQDRVIGGFFTMMRIKSPNAHPTLAPAVITLPSISKVKRPSFSLSMALQTI